MTIDAAISDLISRLQRTDATIKAIADISGVSVGTVWALRAASDPSEIAMTATVLRRVSAGLDALEAASGTAQSAVLNNVH